MPDIPAGIWPWIAVAGIGLFHGINPAMGWLFAVALGLHRNSQRVVLLFFELGNDIGHFSIRSDLFNGAFCREIDPSRPVLVARSFVTLLARESPSERAFSAAAK